MKLLSRVRVWQCLRAHAYRGVRSTRYSHDLMHARTHFNDVSIPISDAVRTHVHV